MAEQNLKLGVIAAIGVLFIWSGFIVFSRAGVLSGLTPYDLAALRFIVAGVLVTPFLWAWWPRNIPIRIQILMVLAGPGALYSVLIFLGLERASAAYGGVFSNGALPLVTMGLAFALAGTPPARNEALGSAVIIAGGVMVAWPGLQQGGPDVAAAIALFLICAAMIGSYIYAIRRFAASPLQVLAVVTIPNTVIFVPLWYVALPSTMADAEMTTIIAQALFQGLGPGFLALMLFAMMANHLGATPTAAVSAAVPATAALLAIPVLGEIPTALEWAGIATVTLGLMLLISRR